MKIYVDVTETVLSRLRTGIQRVVRAIMANTSEISKERNVEIIPVMACGDYLYPLHDENRLFKPEPIRAPPRFLKIVSIGLRRFPAVKLYLRKLVIHALNSRDANEQTAPPISPEKGDVLLLLDSFWGTKRIIPSVARFHQAGGVVISVIYDMIPITHPQYCDDENVINFIDALGKLLKYMNGIIAISRSGADDIARLLPSIESDGASELRVAYFYLGADFSTTITTNKTSARWPKGLWTDEYPVYMTVGTIEPRKKHAFVLDAFEARWQRGNQDRLLIIGKVGWKTENLVKRILDSKYYGKLLYMVNDASDAELEEAYGRAFACIMASEIEGFGLPVIESLQRQLPVLASDIPVFREIGGEFCQYFALGDVASLDTEIDKLSANIEDVRARMKGFKWLTWKQAAEQLFDRVITMASSRD